MKRMVLQLIWFIVGITLWNCSSDDGIISPEEPEEKKALINLKATAILGEGAQEVSKYLTHPKVVLIWINGNIEEAMNNQPHETALSATTDPSTNTSTSFPLAIDASIYDLPTDGMARDFYYYYSTSSEKKFFGELDTSTYYGADSIGELGMAFLLLINDENNDGQCDDNILQNQLDFTSRKEGQDWVAGVASQFHILYISNDTTRQLLPRIYGDEPYPPKDHDLTTPYLGESSEVYNAFKVGYNLVKTISRDSIITIDPQKTAIPITIQASFLTPSDEEK